MARKKKPKERRDYGSGSIYESPKGSGRWWAALRIDKRLFRRTATSEQAAATKLEELNKLRARNIDVASGLQPYSAWLNTYHQEKQRMAKPKPRTVEAERALIERYIIPKLGDMRLIDIRPQHIQTFVESVYTDIRSTLDPDTGQPRYDGARTANAAARVVEESLILATKRKLIEENPYQGINPPRYEEKEITPLDDAQIRRFLQAGAGGRDDRARYTTANGRTKRRPKVDRLQALWALFVLLGWRRGEALGALWQGVDWDAGTIAITQQVQRLSGYDADGNPTVQLHIGTPKTKAGRRTLPLGRRALALLKAHYAATKEEYALLGVAWTGQGHIFCSVGGDVLWPDNVERMFRRVRAAAGLPATFSLHHTRHTLATLIDESGVATEAIKAGILGHAKQGISGKYTHARIAAMRVVLQAVEDRVFGAAEAIEDLDDGAQSDAKQAG